MKALDINNCDFGTAESPLNLTKLKNLTELTSLDISTYYYNRRARGGSAHIGQPFKGFKAFCNLKKLKELYLYQGEVTTLPACVGQLRNLEHL